MYSTPLINKKTIFYHHTVVYDGSYRGFWKWPVIHSKLFVKSYCMLTKFDSILKEMHIECDVKPIISSYFIV